jgi:hypothetical protein
VTAHRGTKPLHFVAPEREGYGRTWWAALCGATVHADRLQRTAVRAAVTCKRCRRSLKARAS